MSIPNLSLAREIASAYQRQPEIAAAPPQAGSGFKVQTGVNGASAQGSGSVGAVGQAAGVAEPTGVDASRGALSVKELVDPSRTGDPVKRLEQIRGLLMEALSEGGGSITMPEMLNLQLLAQDATRTLELTTKVAEHATSGVKTVLQTQA